MNMRRAIVVLVLLGLGALLGTLYHVRASRELDARTPALADRGDTTREAGGPLGVAPRRYDSAAREVVSETDAITPAEPPNLADPSGGPEPRIGLQIISEPAPTDEQLRRLRKVIISDWFREEPLRCYELPDSPSNGHVLATFEPDGHGNLRITAAEPVEIRGVERHPDFENCVAAAFVGKVVPDIGPTGTFIRRMGISRNSDAAREIVREWLERRAREGAAAGK